MDTMGAFFKVILLHAAPKDSLKEQERKILGFAPDRLHMYILKGVWHEIFELRFFSWISVPQAQKYSTGAVLNFVENSRRYSRINVYRRCKRHRRKAVQRCQRPAKSCSGVSTTPAKNLSPVSIFDRWYRSEITKRPKIYRRCQRHRWKPVHRCQRHRR